MSFIQHWLLCLAALFAVVIFGAALTASIYFLWFNFGMVLGGLFIVIVLTTVCAVWSYLTYH